MLLKLARTLIKPLFRVKLAGAYDQAFSARTVFVANHVSLLDGIFMALFVPAKTTFLVASEVLDKPFYRFLLKSVDHYGIDPTSPLSLKALVRLLEQDKSVVIFPEGRITVTGGLMQVYDGAAFVAAKTGADVVAVHLEGPQYSYLSYLKGLLPRKLFPKVTLTFMPARKMAMPEGGTAKSRRAAAGEELRRILQETIFAARPVGTLFDGFMDAVERHGRAYPVAEDMQLVKSINAAGKAIERKKFIIQNYGDLLQSMLAVQRIASKISAPGDRVGVLLPNSTGTAAVVLGLSSGGRVPAMLNFTAGPDGIQSALTASDTRLVLTSRKFLEVGKLTHLVANLDGATVLYMEDLKAQFGLADKLWLKLYALRCPRATAHPANSSDPAVVLFTSGSEGKPKGVVHTHDSLRANIAQVCAVADFSPADKFLVALPLFHSFGLTAGTLLPLLNGCKVFFYPTPLHYKVIPEVVYQKQATVLFGTATFLAGYAKHAKPQSFFRLRYVVAGAEKLPETVRAVWAEKFGLRVLEGYGITETAPVLSVNTPLAYKLGTVGSLLPGIEYKLEPVPGIEQGGLLHVKGPNVMKGYYLYGKPGEISPFESAMGDGWYSTGDIVTVDADRFVTIKGRAKRFAKLAGEMVSLEVVESIAAAAAPAFQHAAVTRPDPAKGEVVVLFTTDAALTQERLAAKAKELGRPGIAVARKVVKIDAIPLLGTGKTDYVALNQLAKSVA